VSGVVALTAAGFGLDIARSLRESVAMFWETLWALVLGFGLSGAVQAFATREGMERRLGDHRPAAVLRACVYGMVSSSCSYAAASMSRSLIRKGADAISAMVFMFASTNLVIELGIVLVVLIGWQFAAAEFIGGAIMVLFLVIVGNALWRRSSGRAFSLPDMDPAVPDANAAGSPERKMRSLGGWADAAAYSIADLKMLRREILIGYTAAGLLATVVPGGFWNSVFIRGHGLPTALENAIVGPFIAIISCVCSIGNVPLAAALWKGGISFGGVVSFLFADLVALPLLFVYRKYYGGAVALRLLGVFWVVMSAAGLVTEGIFGLAGLIPTRRPVTIAPIRFGLDSTGILDVVFLAVFLALYLLYRNRARLGGGAGYDIDPVCGMQVRVHSAPATAAFGGATYHFCSERCRDRFLGSPARYVPALRRSVSGGEVAAPSLKEEDPVAIDPVCLMTVEPETAAAHREHDGRDYYFCALSCAERFDADPARYAGEAAR